MNANTRQSRANVKQLSDVSLACRFRRHQWDHLGFYRDGNGPIVVSVLRCRACKTVRDDVIGTGDGEVAGRHYAYQDGYLVKGGVHHVDVRLEAIRRATVHTSRKALGA